MTSFNPLSSVYSKKKLTLLDTNFKSFSEIFGSTWISYSNIQKQNFPKLIGKKMRQRGARMTAALI